MSDEVKVMRFKALNIAQQHWTMGVMPCACGAAWEKGAQGLVIDADGPADEWQVQCPACGERAVFRFDISAYYGHKADLERWLEERLPEADPRLRARLARKVGAPFGVRFPSVVQGLAADGDVPTLLYLRAEIDRALASVGEGGALSPESDPEGSVN